ncbi:MAG: MotB family protein [Pseudomonadota bacterium]
MENEKTGHEEIIIVKRGHDDHDDHHGGVWKIAFADFMTAMMAFFLVMWLINASNEQTRKAVASYFNPIKLMDTTSNPKGVKNPKYGVEQTEAEEDEDSTKVANSAKKLVAADGAEAIYDEQALFVDPFALLSEIEGGISEDADSSPSAAMEAGEKKNGIGLNGGISFQDPFDPSVWNIREGGSKGEGEGDSEETGVASLRNPVEGAENFMPGENEEEFETEIDRLDRKSNTETKANVGDNEEARKLTEELEQRISELQNSREFPELNIEVMQAGNGATVVLSDKGTNGMFNIGSARPMPDLVRVMKRIGKIISKHKGKLEISGHTDGRKYQSDEYDNWRLSTARAHMAYYMLARGGMKEERVEKIVGQAAVNLKDPANPYSAVNRRIEVLLKVE